LCKKTKIRADDLDAILAAMPDVERIVKQHPKNKTKQSASGTGEERGKKRRDTFRGRTSKARDRQSQTETDN
jgi:hypothetical protein